MDVATWLWGRTPLGIRRKIPERKIFPPTEPTRAQLESEEYLAARAGGYEVVRNYSSFHEHEVEVRTELERLIGEGHLERIGTWADVLARWPHAMATKVATLVKTKENGQVKVRFIVDMLRSGVNALATTGERIVLPRGGRPRQGRPRPDSRGRRN